MENDSSLPPPPAEMKTTGIGRKCVQHPAVDASHTCRQCGAGICATCDFVLPGDIHFCPSCATKPDTSLSERRKNSQFWSYICAAGSTVGFCFATLLTRRSGHTAESIQLAGVIFTVFVFIPSIIGLGVGLGAIDRRRHNPISLWGATIWNGLILGIFILLSIVGTMSRHG